MPTGAVTTTAAVAMPTGTVTSTAAAAATEAPADPSWRHDCRRGVVRRDDRSDDRNV